MNIQGKRAKVTKTITSVNGALHEGEVVLIERRENGHWRCRDNMGRIFYMEESNLKVVNRCFIPFKLPLETLAVD